MEHGLFGIGSLSEFEQVTRAAVFQLVSVCTTTGFVSENFNLWPSITLVILLMFMLMGGCAGSTGGGVKVMRLVMLFRLAYLETLPPAAPPFRAPPQERREVRAR